MKIFILGKDKLKRNRELIFFKIKLMEIIF